MSNHWAVFQRYKYGTKFKESTAGAFENGKLLLRLVQALGTYRNDSYADHLIVIV